MADYDVFVRLGRSYLSVDDIVAWAPIDGRADEATSVSLSNGHLVCIPMSVEDVTAGIARAMDGSDCDEDCNGCELVGTADCPFAEVTVTPPAGATAAHDGIIGGIIGCIPGDRGGPKPAQDAMEHIRDLVKLDASGALAPDELNELRRLLDVTVKPSAAPNVYKCVGTTGKPMRVQTLPVAMTIEYEGDEPPDGFVDALSVALTQAVTAVRQRFGVGRPPQPPQPSA